VKQLTILLFDKAHAGGGRHYDITVIKKLLDKFFAYLFAIVPISVVECRMTATGLFRIIVYCTVEAFQYLYHVPGCFRKKLIDIAGNENVDNHLFVRLRQM
jgi:hypothetical protein